ncbi:S8 family serine peptidase [Longitalea luteola]|uniref:S8 family serine peptidase n=1 Tax=Longitalea luteola TaxID=2812563 RepID=UPI001A964F75|nr:S8 family serine peptidase [Longitalea luteola]
MPNACSLHIGLNKVDPNHYSGWNGQLFCCENDALFYSEMAEKAGITDRKLLLSSGSPNSEMPTSANLDKHLKHYKKNLKSGDFLLITYSGHGGQIRDLNFDEPDEVDETWCLYDRQYVDDELWEHFSQFEKGVRILVIADSCHSESAVRVIDSEKDAEMERLMTEVFNKMQLVQRYAPKEITFPTAHKHKQEYYTATHKPLVIKEDVAASVLLMAACRDEEKACEWDGFGLFTSTLRKVLSMNKQITSYEDWHDKILKLIPKIQHPTIRAYGYGADLFLKEKILQTGAIKSQFSFFIPDHHTAQPAAAENIIIDFGKSQPAVKATYEPAVRMKRDETANTSIYLTKTPDDPSTAWDSAYKEYFELKAAHPQVFVEPDIKSKYLKETPLSKSAGDNNYMSGWPKPPATLGIDEFIWHLDDNHSQLKAAAERVREKLKLTHELNNVPHDMIRIAHIDTGYIPTHPATPKYIMADAGTSFVNGEADNKGTDVPRNRIKPLEQDGHGSATLAILAGNYIQKADSYAAYEGFFGAIPFARIVPIRICDTVYNSFNANDVASGIEYALEMGCEVITMSMAGYPTRRVAQAVNKAYEAGVVVVTAAGNNWTRGISKLTPKAVMYPARFDRVIAACGVCYNEKPYDLAANEEEMKLRSEGGDTMQGNWGPERAMQTALAAYTPNLAWANNNPDYKYRFSRTGGGTSSATPQIAAAAALWILFNREQLQEKKYKGTWKQAEAVRQALFRSGGIDYPGYKKYYGNGSLKASAALDMSDEILALELQPAEEASVSFLGIGKFVSQWFRSMPTKEGMPAAMQPDDKQLQDMLSVEIMQVMYKDPALFDYLDTLDLDGADQDYFNRPAAMDKFRNAIKASSYASTTLKALL